jgi:hypothetical protein
MPLDQTTLDSDTPKTLDGREYPEHLKAYHAYDAEFLSIAARLGEFTFDDLAARVTDPKMRAMIPRWLASAEWRGLIERRDRDMASVRINAITERGQAHLQAA